MSAEPSDRSLLARVHGGSETAATALYQRYASRLLALARANTGTDLRARIDPEDIVQSVFGSFFRGVQQGYYQAPPGEELWGLFLVMALNKIRSKGAHHRAARRDIRRTRGGEALAVGIEAPETDAAAEQLLRLVINDVLEGLPASHAQVIRLRIEGHEVAEVAVQTGRSKRTVERILQEFRQRLAAAVNEEGSDDPDRDQS